MLLSIIYAIFTTVIFSLFTSQTVTAFTIINQTSEAVILEVQEADEKKTVNGNTTRTEMVPLKNNTCKVTIPAKSRLEITIDSCPALLISIIKETTEKKFFKSKTRTTTTTIAKIPYNYLARQACSSFSNEWGFLISDLVDQSNRFMSFNNDNPTIAILHPKLLVQITNNDQISTEVQKMLSLSPR